MPQTVVVNTKDPGGYDVYIGRAFRMYAKQGPRNPYPGYFGNPFKVAEHEDAIGKFREFFLHRVQADPVYAARVRDLKGKRIACFCAPGPCHGDVIAEWVNSQP